MSDSLVQKYATRRPEDSAFQARLDRTEEAGAVDSMGAFGWLRGVRERAIMLELRRKTGDILAIGYGWIDRVQFDPSEGITLHMGGPRILVKGRNLNTEVRPHVRLFEGIVKQRVPWLRELDRAELADASAAEAIIDKIEW